MLRYIIQKLIQKSFCSALEASLTVVLLLLAVLVDVDIHMTLVLTWVMVTVRVGGDNAIAAAAKRFLKFIGLCMLCLDRGQTEVRV